MFYLVAEGEGTEYDYIRRLNSAYGTDLRFLIETPPPATRRNGLPPDRRFAGRNVSPVLAASPRSPDWLPAGSSGFADASRHIADLHLLAGSTVSHGPMPSSSSRRLNWRSRGQEPVARYPAG